MRYDYVIVGGGIAGISCAEMISRSGSKCLLIEKESKLASKTSADFHEWYHTGALYTVTNDNFQTTKYLLGAVDELFSYYSQFQGMNLRPSFKGLKVDGDGWFIDDNIVLKYKRRPLNPIWTTWVARSISAIQVINAHDWVRKRGGSEVAFKQFWKKSFIDCYRDRNRFHQITSSDLQLNSRKLINDLLCNFQKNDGEILTDTTVLKIEKLNGSNLVITNSGDFLCAKVILANADDLKRFIDSPLLISYAPMMIVDRLDKNAPSFVELDYNVKNCINLLNKRNGIGLAGGISLKRKDAISEYFDYCKREHLIRHPEIRFIGEYVGIKKELSFKGESRNYLYHVIDIDDGVLGVVLGKFSLFPSLASELYRRFFGRNPPLITSIEESFAANHELVASVRWSDFV